MGKELNAEAVLASIIELRASIAEQGAELRASIAEQGAELRASIELTNSRVDKTNERLDKAIEQLVENNAKLYKNNLKLTENNNKVGSLTNKLGGIIESVVMPGIVEKFNEKGFGFDSVSTNVEFFNENKTANLAEVDGLLENGSFVIAVEAKTEMDISDVNAHIERLNVLRKIPRFKGKKIYGAFATAVARKRPVNYALEHGLYVLQQPDVMGVKILDFPKGCSAKAW